VELDASRIEILTIGDELLDGRLVDTNAAELSEQLVAAGFPVVRHVSVGDDLEQVAEALRDAAERSDAVLVSGGLGPTGDDLTAAAAALAFGLPLTRCEEALDHVRRFFADRGRRMTANNEKQADLPAGSTLLPNPEGTAVGFRLRSGDCRLYFMPGVPRELARMFDDSVLPDLGTYLTPSPPAVATLKVFGKGESEVAQMLEGLEDELPPGARLIVQYRATFPEIHIRLLVRCESAAAAADIAARLAEQARQRLGRYVFAWGGNRLATTFADHVVDRLRRAGSSLAAAEGCTGGELAALVCSAAGAEDVFRGSVVVADRVAQGTLFGFDDASAEGQGALSAGVAEALARAVRERLAADLGVAAVGSPTGGEGFAPGALSVAVADHRGSTSRELLFPVDAERFRRLAAYAALAAAVRSLDQPPS